uniref:ADP-ribosylation factor-like protein 6-interacting protein 4 n=1 Tax=Pyramimonas obovata TaxID=1411642 RepID=A0A7S0RCW2_9CHLO|mmetsp:Transcript_30997/g.67714  ORF Transcript_30997/g.67714 Transcript_30997/m.67714 type:complete len:216 (+) Transcript_30997:114-761(+)
MGSHKRSRGDSSSESDDSSDSSSSSGAAPRKDKKRHRKLEEAKEKKSSKKKEKKRKHKKEKSKDKDERKKGKRERKESKKSEKSNQDRQVPGGGQPSPSALQSTTAKSASSNKSPATLGTKTNVGVLSAREPPRRVMTAPMTQEAAAKAAARIERVWDPELGRMRAVRGDGQIVEECVSQQEQRRIMSASANHVSVRQYTGKDKFPSQHPWFGYK